MRDNKFLILLGARIRQIRLKKGFSQQVLAEKCQFEKANLSRIESGRTNISILTLKKIAKALDTGIIDFFKYWQ